MPSLAQVNYRDRRPPIALGREMPQSRSRKKIVFAFCRNLFASASAPIFAIASSGESPLYGPEFTSFALLMLLKKAPSTSTPPSRAPPFERPEQTTRIGRPYFLQNSKSRASCAGTAMMAAGCRTPSGRNCRTQRRHFFSPLKRICCVAAGEENFFFRRSQCLPPSRNFSSASRALLRPLMGGLAKLQEVFCDVWDDSARRNQRGLPRKSCQCAWLKNFDPVQGQAHPPTANLTFCGPCDLPIQLRCMVMTRSGQLPSSCFSDRREADQRKRLSSGNHLLDLRGLPPACLS